MIPRGRPWLSHPRNPARAGPVDQNRTHPHPGKGRGQARTLQTDPGLRLGTRPTSRAPAPPSPLAGTTLPAPRRRTQLAPSAPAHARRRLRAPMPRARKDHAPAQPAPPALGRSRRVRANPKRHKSSRRNPTPCAPIASVPNGPARTAPVPTAPVPIEPHRIALDRRGQEPIARVLIALAPSAPAPIKLARNVPALIARGPTAPSPSERAPNAPGQAPSSPPRQGRMARVRISRASVALIHAPLPRASKARAPNRRSPSPVANPNASPSCLRVQASPRAGKSSG